jgi:catechol 2,3-dioxygenase-like lactoylglutathione lyase family enzyme
MNLGLDRDYAVPQLFWPNVIRALGQAIIMTPISAIALVGVAQTEAGAASGLFNMMRDLGGAIGTTAIETFFTHREQFHSAMITPKVSLLEPATRDRLADLQRYFMAHGYPDPAGAMHRDRRGGPDDPRPGHDHGLRRQLRADRSRVAGRRAGGHDAAQGRCRRRGGVLNQAYGSSKEIAMTQRISIDRVDHIGIRVRDLDRALSFYRVLGFDLLLRAQGDDVAIVRNENGVELNLIFNANAGELGTNVLMDVPGKYPGYTHMAFRVASIPATIAALKENDIAVTQGPVSFGESGQVSVFIRDPDRNVIELRGRDQDVVEGVTRYVP